MADGTGSITQWDRAGHIWQGNVSGIKKIGPDTWYGNWAVDNHRIIISIIDREHKVMDIWEMQPEQHWIGQFTQEGDNYEVKGMLPNSDRGYAAELELPSKAHSLAEEARKYAFPLGWTFFQFKSLHVGGVSYEGEWIVGNIDFEFTWLNKPNSFKQPFKTEINESFPVQWKVFAAEIHVWLDGPKCPSGNMLGELSRL